MPLDTVIVGDEKSRFLYISGDESRNVCGSAKYFTDAVALVFAKDKEKICGESLYLLVYWLGRFCLCYIFLFYF